MTILITIIATFLITALICLGRNNMEIAEAQVKERFEANAECRKELEMIWRDHEREMGKLQQQLSDARDELMLLRGKLKSIEQYRPHRTFEQLAAESGFVWPP